NADCQIAWPAGQMKKTSVITICGAISRYGSQGLRNVTRLVRMGPAIVGGSAGPGDRARQRISAVRLLKRAQQLVAAFDGRVQRFLGGLVAGPEVLQLLVDDVAHLREVAEANAAAVLGRFVQRKLPNRRVGARVLFVEPL